MATPGCLAWSHNLHGAAGSRVVARWSVCAAHAFCVVLRLFGDPVIACVSLPAKKTERAPAPPTLGGQPPASVAILALAQVLFWRSQTYGRDRGATIVASGLECST